MINKLLLALLTSALIVLLLPSFSSCNGNDRTSARVMDPIVSTGWLDTNSGLEQLVILDIRSTEAYEAGHIQNAINEPFVVPISKWITIRDDLILEVPEKAELFGTIGSLGITAGSWVVIVTEPNAGEPPHYGLANATRVADTLIYAGIPNVAILDGGYPKWVAEGLPTTTVVPTVTPVTYLGSTVDGMFVSREYVQAQMGTAAIVDARDADVYFGVTIEPFAAKPGHIPTARCLPAPWIWNENADGTYTYKDSETLGAMASGVLPGSKTQEIIVYCGVGGYASSWWFVLTQILDYENVRFYDGAAQEWVLYYDMVPYQWN